MMRFRCIYFNRISSGPILIRAALLLQKRHLRHPWQEEIPRLDTLAHLIYGVENTERNPSKKGLQNSAPPRGNNRQNNISKTGTMTLVTSRSTGASVPWSNQPCKRGNSYTLAVTANVATDGAATTVIPERENRSHGWALSSIPGPPCTRPTTVRASSAAGSMSLLHTIGVRWRRILSWWERRARVGLGLQSPFPPTTGSSDTLSRKTAWQGFKYM